METRPDQQGSAGSRPGGLPPVPAAAPATAATNGSAPPEAAAQWTQQVLERLKKLPWAKLKPGKPDLKRLFAPFLVVLIVVLFITYGLMLHSLRAHLPGKEISLSELNSLAAAAQVKEATFLEADANLVIRYAVAPLIPASEPVTPTTTAAPPKATQRGKAPTTTPAPAPAPPTSVVPAFPTPLRTAWVAYPLSDSETNDIVKTLIGSGSKVSFNHQAGKVRVKFLAQFLFPLLILASVFSFFFLLITGNAGGASDFLGFSKFAAKIQRRKKGQGVITFKDVAAIDEGITELQEVVDYLMNPERFASLGARAPKGVLLAGPPGTGKTLLAKAVAGEANVPFIQLSGSEFVESLVGVGAARVRDLFKQARALAPAIIFIDELDAAGRMRGAGVGQGNDEREQTLNQLLVEMDGFSTSLGIAILGATNRPDILDPALLRPGRFDRQVVIDVPDVRGRTAILEVHARSRPLAPECDLAQIAKETPGFTGAELANILNEGALLAVRRSHPLITQDDLEEAVDRVISGPERKSHLLSPEEKILIAYHEAGHAVVARATGQETGVLKLSIVARGLQLGHASTYSSADRLVMLHSDIENQLAVLLGGLAAEKLLFGELSTGNTGDLEKATTLARKLVATYGMSEAVGSNQVLHEGQVFMGRDFAAAQHTAPDTLNLVDREIHRVLEKAEQRAVVVCRQNLSALDEIVRLLLVKETVMGLEIEPILERVARAPQSHALTVLSAMANNGDAGAKRRPRKAASKP